MPNYTKLFNSIVTSTIWTEDDKTRIVWITMLAISDQHGEVQASIPGLARVAGVSIEAVENALNKFLSPDAYSRTPDDEGRRIEKIEGGWLLLNHAKYRAMASKEDSKSANAKRQRRHREKTERNAAVTDSNACVTLRNATVTHGRDIAEAEADTKAESDKEAKRKSIKRPILESEKDILRLIWESCPKASRERSSKKELALEWGKIKASDRPSKETIETALAAWTKCAKWKDGFSEGIHLWVKRAQWENLPEPASAKSQGTYATRHANDNSENLEIPDL
jgi:hypothetical protein